jgi:PST family polysaccharide transporter
MLRVTVGMGISSAVVILLSVARVKLVAVEEGRSGVGTLSLLIALITLATLVFGLGIASSAIREIAARAAAGDLERRNAMRWATYAASIVLGLVTGAIMIVAAGPFAAHILGDRSLAGELRWAAVAAVATIVSGAVAADLNGLRRIRALAAINPLAAAVATAALGLAASIGGDLVLMAVVAPPLALLIVSLAWSRSLPRLGLRPPVATLFTDATRLIGLGVAFMLNAVVAALGVLGVRLIIDTELGRDAIGEFQAAFVMAGYYLGFLFAAMAADFFPVLSGLTEQPARLNQTADAQLHFGLLVAVPPLMALLLTSELVVPVLYSGDFDNTPELLRIMLVAEAARVAAWTLGYVLAAAGRGRLFVVSELGYNTLLVGTTAGLVQTWGLDGAAVAYLIAQIGGFALALWLAHRATGYSMSSRTTTALILASGGLAAVYAAASAGGVAIALGLVLTAAATVLALREVRRAGGGLRALLRAS